MTSELGMLHDPMRRRASASDEFRATVPAEARHNAIDRLLLPRLETALASTVENDCFLREATVQSKLVRQRIGRPRIRRATFCESRHWMRIPRRCRDKRSALCPSRAGSR